MVWTMELEFEELVCLRIMGTMASSRVQRLAADASIAFETARVDCEIAVLKLNVAKATFLNQCHIDVRSGGLSRPTPNLVTGRSTQSSSSGHNEIGDNVVPSVPLSEHIPVPPSLPPAHANAAIPVDLGFRLTTPLPAIPEENYSAPSIASPPKGYRLPPVVNTPAFKTSQPMVDNKEKELARPTMPMNLRPSRVEIPVAPSGWFLNGSSSIDTSDFTQPSIFR